MRLDFLTPEEGVEAIIQCAKASEGGYCCVSNVHQCIETVDNSDFRDVVKNATLVWSDSTILQKACALRHGDKSPPVIKGADMMRHLLAAAAVNDMPVGLYGANEKTIGLLQDKLSAEFPELQLVYAYSPHFRPLSEEEDAEIVDDINNSGARLLFIGLGCPKQERWMAAHTDRLPGVMMIGVGAAFDFNAGTVKPSPQWVHRYGVEWLYRLASEPRRLGRRYLSTSPRFVMLLALDMLKARSRRHGR